MTEKKPAMQFKRNLKTGEGRTESVGKPPVKRQNRIKLLLSVVNPSDESKLKEILDDCSVALSFTVGGRGTAHSRLLDYLGIDETEKSIVASLIPESDEDEILKVLRARMALYLVGRGISFTIPLTGISELTANGLARAATNKADGRKSMKEERKYDLIVAAVEAGNAEEAMEAARSAGAAGGTILLGRALDNVKAEQFIGISLARGQEILLVLAKHESKIPIMEALMEKVGLKTEAGGIVFSLPVDKTAGISAADEAGLLAESGAGIDE